MDFESSEKGQQTKHNVIFLFAESVLSGVSLCLQEGGSFMRNSI